MSLNLGAQDLLDMQQRQFERLFVYAEDLGSPGGFSAAVNGCEEPSTASSKSLECTSGRSWSMPEKRRGKREKRKHMINEDLL